MGNKLAPSPPPSSPPPTPETHNMSDEIRTLFREFQTDLMGQFTEQDKGTRKKFDAIYFCANIRDILITDPIDTKFDIEHIVNEYETCYPLSNTQKQLIRNIINTI
jgi:hypothetical protein